ncbi:MAG: RNA polymerase sigma factor [Bacteroidales bacterium]|nr:RNA polymerase sigma factor [Bacteroidales bacterium]
MDDKQLVEKIKNNNDIAFRILIKKYKGLVMNTVYRLIGNKMDSEDVFQDVFLEVYRSIHKLRNIDDISGWLFRISYNKSLSFLRKKNPAKAGLSTDFLGVVANMKSDINSSKYNKTPADIYIQKEANKILFKAIDNLPGKQKKALLLHKFENYSQKEICKIMNLSQASVESLIYRSKIKLRKSLANYFKDHIK